MYSVQVLCDTLLHYSILPIYLFFYYDVHHVHYCTSQYSDSARRSKTSLFTGATYRCWIPVDRAALQKD